MISQIVDLDVQSRPWNPLSQDRKRAEEYAIEAGNLRVY